MAGYQDFKKKVLTHLSEWNKLNNANIAPGIYIDNNGKTHEKEYILPLEIGEEANSINKAKAIEKYHVLTDGIKLDIKEIGTLHEYAHHLNSSQIMCYNFFKAMTASLRPKAELVSVLEGEFNF